MKNLDIDDLSVEQKIGQMLLMRNPIDQADLDFVLDMIRNHALGGLHVSHKYVKDGYFARDERAVLDKVLAVADYPILVCEDMECGFPKGSVSMPYQIALGAADSEELAYEYGRITAIEAKAAGYNVVFGPILDIAENPRSCCVGSRSYGGDKELVARLGSATIRGYQDNGMIVAAKHFPGFGESEVDNHIGMVHLGGDQDRILRHEMHPYRHAMKHAALSGIMMGHIMIPKIDPVFPASISAKVIGLLRGTGYGGLIMTDSFAMIGMTTHFELGECHKLAMAAGNDMVMTSYRMSAREAYGLMLEAFRTGRVTEAQITLAARHVVEAQGKTLRRASKDALDDTDRSITQEIAARSVAGTFEGVASLAIDPQEKHLFIIQEGVVYKDPVSGAIASDPCDLQAVSEALKLRFANSDFVTLPEFPVKPQIEHVLAMSLRYASVVMVLANKSVSYTGSSDASQRMVAVIDGLRSKLSAVLLFGSPYAAREFGAIKRIIFGFDGRECQRMAAQVLAGEHVPTGRIPVKVQAQRGV